jgi:hypothetical protein
MSRRRNGKQINPVLIQDRFVSLVTKCFQPDFSIFFHTIERFMPTQITESICVMLVALLLRVCTFPA